MSWITRGSGGSSQSGGTQRATFRQSLEMPIAFEAGGRPAPVYGTLIDLSETGCRLRSLVLLDRECLVRFELRRGTGAALKLRGHVAGRRSPRDGGGYEYGISFDSLAPQERKALLEEIMEMQRRDAAARMQSRTEKPPAPPDQRRKDLRQSISFPISFRRPGSAWQNAFCADVSAGGIRLACGDAMEDGTEIEIRFTLPSDVLEVFPKGGERTEITPFGPRKVRVPDNRRSFDQIYTRGHVVAKLPPLEGRNSYGVEFANLDGYSREEIMRFNHALQLRRLRNGGK
ncbi:MAG TPA: PilZ domain-containing protein [Candidatus Dormibacteraeota bacterium]|nr:PilZ domain-containing protein [Candidatus Dormibacteraeota bacterium]